MKNLENASDYELIDLFLSRKVPESRDAFRVFHDRYAGYMMSVARERAYSSFRRQWEEVAEDVVQDAFLKIFQSLPKFQKTANLTPEKQTKHLKTWLYRIVENSYIDYYKKYYHESLDLEEQKGIAQFLVVHTDVGEVTRSLPRASRERHDRILREVAKLSDRELEILRAYVRYGTIDDEDNWTLEPEVLERLSQKYGVKPNSIQQTKKRIIAKLRENLNSKS